MGEGAKRMRRGRPRGGASDARQRIIAAAIDEFAEHGYDGATIRAIAARAEVDPALVHHYFGSKADLFGEAAQAPIRPDLAVAEILSGPRDEIGERIIRFFLDAWERPEVRKRGTVMLRTAIGSRMTQPLLVGFLTREVLGPAARALGTDDAGLRASLAGSQIAGLIIARYILKFPGLADAPVEELVRRVGPAIQHYLTGELPAP